MMKFEMYAKKLCTIYTPYTNVPKTCFWKTVIFIAQFNYCPLVWMCHSRKDLWQTFYQTSQVFSQLFSKTKETFKNLDLKSYEGLSPLLMTELLELTHLHPYNTRHVSDFYTMSVNTVNTLRSFFYYPKKFKIFRQNNLKS